MSALIAVAKSDCIDILTDAVVIRARDGIVERFTTKQFLNFVPGVAIAINGLIEPARQFAVLAYERCASHDALVEACEDIWAECRIAAPVAYSLAFAGWSDARQALELISLAGHEAEGIVCAVIAAGPTEETAEAIAPFNARFDAAPDGFDARRDGVGLMQELRGYRRQFGDAACHCVGGWVEHSIMRRDGIAKGIIHRWPEDRVGAPISLSPSSEERFQLPAAH